MGCFFSAGHLAYVPSKFHWVKICNENTRHQEIAPGYTLEIKTEPKHGGLEADVPDVNGVIFRFQPLIFRGVCRELTSNHTDPCSLACKSQGISQGSSQDPRCWGPQWSHAIFKYSKIGDPQLQETIVIWPQSNPFAAGRGYSSGPQNYLISPISTGHVDWPPSCSTLHRSPCILQLFIA